MIWKFIWFFALVIMSVDAAWFMNRFFRAVEWRDELWPPQED